MKTRSLALLIIALMAAVVLAGCQDKENENNGSPFEVRMIDVDLKLPETHEPGEPLQIEAVVTLNGEPVLDTAKVNFEIWRQGEGGSEDRYPGEHIGDGVYAIEHTFETGAYYVVSHVDVEEMHNMPKKRIIVGDVSQEELEVEDNYAGMDHGDHSGHGDHDEHHDAVNDHGAHGEGNDHGEHEMDEHGKEDHGH